MTRTIHLLLAFSISLALTACGTDTSSGDRDDDGFSGGSTPGVTVTSSGGSPSGRSGFSLRLTDAPVEGLARVVVSFAAIEVKRKKQGWIRYTLSTPQPIDLLALQGLTTADLLLNMPIEPGEYKQIRFIVDDAPMANHVVLKTGGMVNLRIPRGATRGIKLKQAFTIPEDRLINLTVDFDLRQSVKLLRRSGEYKLASKMRLVVDDHVGFIRGSVSPALLLDPSCSDLDADTHNSAYVYDGHDAVIDDINLLSSADTGPLTTTNIGYDAENGLYIYEAAFLPEGEYTIAFTCNADLDDIEADDNLPIFFKQNVTVLVSDKTFLRP